jgi:hypothetical protein
LATALAVLGHGVHVICQSTDISRVEFDAGVWVHRIVSKNVDSSKAAYDRQVPPHIWNWSATALCEIRRIASHRSIDVVEAPIWDCQGIAILLKGDWPLVTSLQTSLRFWLRSQSERLNDRNWMAVFGTPMLRLEQELMQKSSAIRSISHAIRQDIETIYGFRFAEGQVVVAPLGLPDVVPRTKESAASQSCWRGIDGSVCWSFGAS